MRLQLREEVWSDPTTAQRYSRCDQYHPPGLTLCGTPCKVDSLRGSGNRLPQWKMESTASDVGGGTVDVEGEPLTREAKGKGTKGVSRRVILLYMYSTSTCLSQGRNKRSDLPSGLVMDAHLPVTPSRGHRLSPNVFLCSTNFSSAPSGVQSRFGRINAAFEVDRVKSSVQVVQTKADANQFLQRRSSSADQR